MYATTEREVETRVRDLAPLVKRIAHHMMASLPPSVEIDDVIQSGMMGLLDAARRYQIVSYEDFAGDEDDSFLERHAVGHEGDPLEVLEERSLRESLVAGIDALPEREKMVMGLYYEQELNLREIGEVLGVSESRVCQIHTQAIARLRVRLREAA